MAEVLICITPDNGPLAWGFGMPVAVQENGFQWGTEETWPKFARVRITDRSVAQVQSYLEDHQAVRDVTLEVNKLDYERAVAEGNMHGFVSMPSVTGNRSESKQVFVKKDVWEARVAQGNYYPFYTAPAVVAVHDNGPLMSDDEVELLGTIQYVTLSGQRMTQIALRKTKVDLDAVPAAIKTQIRNGQIVSVTAAQIAPYLVQRVVG